MPEPLVPLLAYLWIIYSASTKRSDFWRGRDIVYGTVLFPLVAAWVFVKVLEVMRT